LGHSTGRAALRIHADLSRRIARLLPERWKLRLRARLVMPAALPVRLPYEPGAHPAGLNLFGYFGAPSGLGQGVRLLASAIDAAHAGDLVRIDAAPGDPLQQGDACCAGPLAGRPVFDVNLVHVNADQMPRLVAGWPEETWNRRFTVGYWLWELPVFPKPWERAFRLVDEVWTPSAFAAEAFSRVSPLTVRVVPYGVSVAPDPSLGRVHFGLPEDVFLFLALFDARSTIARKNPYGALDAFETAFGRTDPSVRLVLKASNLDPRESAALSKRLSAFRNVHLVRGILAKPALDALVACCDAFVSLHRSEGFGLAIAEAMRLGKPAVATGWSANAEWMGPENACPVAYRLVEVRDDYVLPVPGQRWADPDLEDAAVQMRRLVADPAYRAAVGSAGRETVRTRFSPERAAERIAQELRRIRENREGSRA